jgi:hypothetical protein
LTAPAELATVTSRRPPYVFSYGMGAESTAALVRILTCPDYRPAEVAPDFANLIVIVAQTGDEWSITGELVTEYVLPLLRRHRVRLVEVARNGPRESDGITILQDTRRPFRMHLDGVYKLSQEHRDSGTMPQSSGYHTCAQKSKGVPLDRWRAAELGDRPYFHMVGYNAAERSRMVKDAGYRMGGLRQPVYPVAKWGWDRQDCVEYLLHHPDVGVVWPKSCCRQCPYVSRIGWDEQLPRFVDRPGEAFRHLIDEYCCLALNPRSGLYGPGRSLSARLERDGATAVIQLADDYMARMPWGLYHVRRRFTAPAKAPRSVRRIGTGTGIRARRALTRMADQLGVDLSYNEPIPGAPKTDGDRDTFERLWVHRRTDGHYPTVEEFFVALPVQPLNKEASTFDERWDEVCHHLGLGTVRSEAAEAAADIAATTSGLKVRARPGLTPLPVAS